jgi:muramoyltetrapeptide carboxypeptidase
LLASSSIESRITDIHEAFLDPKIKAIIASDGGFNSNQLLNYLNWDLIAHHPKIFCGYSDVTALNHAILKKTGLVTYSGPMVCTLGSDFGIEYTLNYFRQCLFQDGPINVLPATQYNDDDWETETQWLEGFHNKGFWPIHEGEAEGTIIGANLSTLQLLQGTQYFPDLQGSILCLEDDYEYRVEHFDRGLQSLIQQPEFSGVKGLIIGRFEHASHAPFKKIDFMIKTKRELDDLPVIGNVDFGHTNPKITLPIGGVIKMHASFKDNYIVIKKH